MSRTTAPEGDVTMPMRRGRRGMGRLRAGIEQAFGRKFLLQLLEGELQRAVTLRLDGFHQIAGIRRALRRRRCGRAPAPPFHPAA